MATRNNRWAVVGVGGKRIQTDWNENDPNSPAYLKNKPNIDAELHYEVVNTLPTEDIDTHCIYLVPSSDPQQGDIYIEWMYINNAWEKIGSTGIAQVNSDWNATSGVAEILNKPTIPEKTSDLINDGDTGTGSIYVLDTDLPTQTSQLTNDGDGNGNVYILNTDLATVATTGDYDDLTNKPTIPTATSDLTNDSGFITINDVPAQVQADWSQSDNTAPDYIKYKPPLPQTSTLETSATPVLDVEDSVIITCTTPVTSLTINRVGGGQYESNVYFTTGNTPFTMTVPNSLDGIVGSTSLQANTDYIVCIKDNRMVISYNGYTGGVTVNNNAPTLAYGQTSTVGTVDGTNLTVTMPAAPVIPTVNDATITIQQNGTTVGTFTTNDATDQTINLTGGGSNDWYGTQEEFNQLYQFDENTNYYIEGELARVATSGSYNDLKDQPTYGDIKNTPTIESIAVRGENITDWYGTKAEFDALEQAGQLEWYKNYYIEGDGAQVNSDWNASSGVAEILNKPSNLVTGVNVSGVDTALTLRQISQADYDALVQGGTVDSNTVYMIS